MPQGLPVLSALVCVSSETAVSTSNTTGSPDSDANNPGISTTTLIVIGAIAGVLLVGGVVGAKIAAKAKAEDEDATAMEEFAEERKIQIKDSQEALIDREMAANKRAMVVERRSHIKQPELEQVRADISEAKSVGSELRQLALYKEFEDLWLRVIPRLQETEARVIKYESLDAAESVEDSTQASLKKLKQSVSLGIAGKLGGNHLKRCQEEADILLQNLIQSIDIPEDFLENVKWGVELLTEQADAERPIGGPRGSGLVMTRVYNNDLRGRIEAYAEEDGLYTLNWSDGNEERVNYSILKRIMEPVVEALAPDLEAKLQDDSTREILVQNFERSSTILI